MPYDDPYSDSFTSIPADGDGEDGKPFNNIRNPTGRHNLIRPGAMDFVGSVDGGGRSTHTNDRSSDPGPRHRNTRGRGRGGGRNRQSDRGRRGRGSGTSQHPQRHPSSSQWSGPQDYPSLISPTSFGHPYNQQPTYGVVGEWSYGVQPMTMQPPAFGFGLQDTLPGVQPHINPRFANQLGFNFSQVSQIPQAPQIPQVSQIPQMPPRAGSPPSSEKYHPGDADLRPMTGHNRWDEESG